MNPETAPDMTPEETEASRTAMRALADVVDGILNGKGTPRHEKQFGFAVLVYPFDQLNRMHINYIGNGKRDDVLTAIKELAARWEGRTQTTETRQ